MLIYGNGTLQNKIAVDSISFEYFTGPMIVNNGQIQSDVLFLAESQMFQIVYRINVRYV